MSDLPGSYPSRPSWRRLVEEPFDLLVVGGGVHGAGVARDAALRGLRVALVERDDWASGSSSRSSRLLHGGLRYLRQGSFALVREALHERDLHLRLAPDLARPLVFRVPRPLPGTTPRSVVRAGIALYGLLSGAPRAARFWGAEPTYRDACVDDARLCLALVLDARRAGATALNYVECVEWLREGDRVTGARVHDRLTGAAETIRARAIVNAGGPWADDLLGEPGARPRLRLTRGTHVVLDGQADASARLFFSPDDGRVLFLLPYDGGTSLLGTTDLDHTGPRRDPLSTPDEVQYLRRAFTAQFPAWASWRAVGILCGLRPLLAEDGAPSAITREAAIAPGGGGTLVSVFGGKLTTYRAVAERVVDRVEVLLGRSPTPCPTRRAFLSAPPADGEPVSAVVQAFAQEDAVRLEDALLRRTTLGNRGALDPALVDRARDTWRRHWGASEAEAQAEVHALLALLAARRAPLAAWTA